MNTKLVKSFSIGLIAASVMALSACGEKKVEFDAAKADFDQKASYAIGAVLGTQLSQVQATQGEFLGKVDTQLILAGFTDALNKKTVMTEQDLQTTLASLEQKVAEGMQAKALKESQDNLKKGEDFLAANAKKDGVKVTKSGLQYKVVKQGEGPTAKAGDVISVIYKGTTIDGTVFDEQKEPVDFTLDNMIPGWIEALQLMNKGSVYELAIPAKLAYGESNAGGVIKPNSVLLFTVTLVDVKSPAAAAAPSNDNK
ncbi:FKBP-type peptidyl-prolyl cis-trans isomerase fkpA precursor [Anaerobiospirillum thomasii]|uniref:Peptidyl-prolyl cis-trans isomerase n=1 Tax=Anaerobiospirillum thomasii TaxID=179995 RepID=A0A2X0V729_9GAMM|nr:FKBP-type peptidyl-prolyl cis-trans isomerase [Anaerobiospirillum thomasii]SPT69673.1 FKBP-type peptidyl-prolyl cis-trans isomerase fkpA precursor [Anaerobiospirillum thomasii]SPT71765.1 FKBP-type peptidyl-prolyl cis-trans isomerase fkpA precursor [Anaerobiospirillum thomasii]